VGGGLRAGAETAATKPARFVKEMAAFAEKDRAGMPEPGGVVFLGSSSIRIWKVGEAFPGVNVINRGFGGSQIFDSVNYFDRVVKPYKPAMVVFYAGDNDIAAGKTPERVAGDLEKLIGLIRGEVPECRVVVIGIKPSISRWRMIEKMREANRLMEGVVKRDGKSDFVSVEEEMLGADGKPRPELFMKDGLHMSAAGYEIWNKKLRPYVEAASSGR
jgi:lysophospholipase L1-like esterase